MVKKILSGLVCAAVILSMTACSKNEYDTSSVSDGSSSDKDDNTSAENNINDLFEKRTSMFEFLPAIDKPNSEDEFICEEVDGVGVKITGTTAQGEALWVPDKLYGKPVLGVNLPKAEFEEIIMPDTVQIFSLNFAKVKYMNIPRNIQYNHSTDGYDMPETNEIVLEAVYFDDGISEIKAMTIGESLKRVSLPDSLTTLGARAFAYCSGLTNIAIPESVKKIDPTAFEDCENIRIKYGELIFTYADRLDLSLECTCDENGISHTMFERSAWGNYEEKTYDDNITYCSRKVEKITIPANINNISPSIFYYCDKLQSIEVDPENENYYSKDGVLFQEVGNYDYLLVYPNARPGKKYTIPDDAAIGYSPFRNCLYLQSLEVSADNEVYSSEDGVLYSTYNGKRSIAAFPGGKTEYDLPDDVSGDFLDEGTLIIVRGLKSVNASKNNESFRSEDGVLYSKDMSKLYAYPLGRTATEYTLPDSVVSNTLSISGIYDNPYLKTIVYKGKSYTHDKFLNELHDAVVYGENGVWVNENGTLTGVSKYAEEIVIPDNVTDVVEYIFNDRDNIKIIKYKNKTYTLNDLKDLFAAVRGEEGLTIVDGKLTAVSPELTEVVIPDRVTEIESDTYGTHKTAFKDCDYLKKVTFGKGITELEGMSFAMAGRASIFGWDSCNNISEIIIPEGVTSIDYFAFYECENLKKITLPNSLKTIGWEVFMGCTNLNEIVIPNSVIDIDTGAFRNCTSLTNITIPDSVTKIAVHEEFNDPVVGVIINNGAFDGCTNIKATYKGKTYDYAHIDDLYKAINGN